MIDNVRAKLLKGSESGSEVFQQQRPLNSLAHVIHELAVATLNVAVFLVSRKTFVERCMPTVKLDYHGAGEEKSGL